MAGQGVLEVTGLPDAPLDAAAAFHGEYLARARGLAGDGDLVVVFAPADHAHHGWRLAAVQELAREMAPNRVNGVVGEDAGEVSEVLFYLQSAGGVTGQLLQVDGKSRAND